jgi:hypothetical protein
MIGNRIRRILAVTMFVLLGSGAVGFAQITTGTVAGTIKDAQGGVVPGATVVLISEAKGTRSNPAITNETGDYVFPNVTPDTYTVEVTMQGFKNLTRPNVKVSGGDRVAVPAMTIEVGGAEETITVAAESPMIQAQSGERSFAISTEQIENLPVNHNNFTSVVALTPGVLAGGASAGGTRLGGAGQNNIMMDGVSAMDTGNNGQMLSMNLESIGEVKVLVQGYQAEYGRSSGLQITAVTKSGTNRFHGSAYDMQSDSDWATNSWAAAKNGDAKVNGKFKSLGYTIGGPVGKVGGNNKLFFFYAHEYRPTTTPINGGNPIRLRVPTAAERAGDFSQTLDQNGALFNLIKDPNSLLPCTATNTAGCFQDGGVPGKIPASRFYGPGMAVLGRYPLPNRTQGPGENWNYEIASSALPTIKNLTQQPAVRIDYQTSPKLRFTGKYSGQRARRITQSGLIPGFSDVYTPYPFITNYGATVNYALSPTTFLEGTYGFIRNQLSGGNEGGILVNDSANRLNGLADFPLLYPDAGVVDQRYYAYQVMQAINPVFWDGNKLNLPPIFGWGTRIQGNANACAAPAPPCQRFPGFLNINRTQDVAVSITKVAGRHTMKAGFYNNHSYKAQNTGAGGIANLSFQGYVDFGNDTNNALDTGFGYANAAVGVFRQYLQQSQLIEGSMIYNNTEGYVQDNWKVNSRLTVDVGVRLTRQQPQYDQFLQMSNFFPNQWSAAAAPLLYVAGCSNGATVCSGNARNAMNPRTGQILTIPAGNTQAAIGTVIPGTGNLNNGIRQAGDGIAKTSYVWPKLVVGPRFGAAYDVSGTQKLVIRGGVGLFFDRPDGNTVFSIPGNPPISTSQDLRNGNLATLSTGLSTVGVPALSIFQYEAQVPASWQWQVGPQIALPWAMALDVEYVGNYGYHRLGAFQGGTTVNLNAVDFGAAYLPENQDPTLGTSAVPGANAFTANLLRPYRGLSTIAQQTTDFHDTYHSMQFSLNRRYRAGLAFGVNYTLGLSFKGNTGLQKRLQHAPDGTITIRADQADYEKLNEMLNLQRHVLKANAVWDLPNLHASSAGAKALSYIVNDWQVSSVFTTNSGSRYDLGFQYQNNGGAVNLTGSPDYNGRVLLTGDLGSGCASDQYRQFAAVAVTGPAYRSVGLESGRNYLVGCPDHTLDLSILRRIGVGGGRDVQFRVDAFNILNTYIINGRNTTVQYRSPTDLTVLNSQTLPDGSLDPARLLPRTAGFGAATTAITHGAEVGLGNNYNRVVQFQVRFSF